MSVVQHKKKENPALEASQYLTYVLSGEEFAVPIMQVKEIIEYRDMTNVPMVPSFIRGAINLRGGVVPVINLAVKFGIESSKITRRTCVVIMEVSFGDDETLMGILVDRVLDVLDIPACDIEPAPAFGSLIRTDFIRGMGKLNDQFVIILDVDRVLSAQEITVVGQLQGESSIEVVETVATVPKEIAGAK